MSLIIENAHEKTETVIKSTYEHSYAHVEEDEGKIRAKILKEKYHFETDPNPGKVGLMIIGLGGNNGTTLLGGFIANKERMEWQTKKGLQTANMYGSATQNSTLKVGETRSQEVFLKLKEVIPMVDPT